MQHTHDEHSERPAQNSHWSFGARLAFAGFLGIAFFFLLSEHRAHLLGMLPFLLLLACPLLHVFHHGSHGGHDDEGGEKGGSATSSGASDRSVPPASSSQSHSNHGSAR